MFRRAIRLTASTACVTGLFAVLITVGTPTIANDDSSRTEAQTQPALAQMNVGPGFIDFGLNVQAERTVLRISGPAGYALTLRNQKPAAVTADLLMDAKPRRLADEHPEISPVWQSLPDGTYLYELEIIGADGSFNKKTGSFEVENGQPFTDDDSAKASESDEQQSNTYEPNWIESVASATLDFLVPSAHAGDSTNDFYDILDGQQDDFTDITLRNFNDNNVAMFNEGGELKFGTGTAGSDDVLMTFSSVLGKVGIHTETPQEVLHLVGPLGSGSAAIKIENSGNAYTLSTGSSTGFRIRQSEPGSTTVFQIEDGAPSGAFVINSSGDMSMTGSEITASGDMTLTGGTPSIDFINTSGDQINWAIRESNDDLMFSQLNGAGPGTHLHIEKDGNVGIGTTVPAKALHVNGQSPDQLGQNNTMLRVENTSGTTAPRRMLELENNGSPLLVYRDTSNGNIWNMSPVGTQFAIALTGTGEQEFLMDGGGNVTIQGSLTENSRRSSKTEFRHIDEQDILQRLENLPIEEWSYKHSVESRHLGPMAEDFHSAFGLGPDDGIAPRDLAGVALAAAKALKTENDRLRERLDRLELQMSGQ